MKAKGKVVKVSDCCVCRKHIDTSKRLIPPQWFGLWRGEILVRAICSECNEDDKNKDWWKE